MLARCHYRAVNREKILRCLFGWMLCIWLNGAYALELTTTEMSRPLSEVIDVLEDPDGRLTIDDIRDASVARRFVSWGKSQDVNVGISRSAWWFRVQLSRDAEAPSSWILEIPYSYNRNLDFYPSDSPPILTGGARAIDSRPVFHPHYVFPILVSTTPEYIYFRAASSYAISLPLTAWQPVAFYKASMKNFFVQAMYYGGIIALLLYNFALFISLRDHRFLLYVGFAFFMCLGVFAGNGLGRLVLWPEWHRFDEVAGTFFILIGTLLSALFSLQFMQTRKHAPRIAFTLHAIVVALAGTAVLQLAGIWYPSLIGPTLQLASLLGLILFAALAIASHFALRARVPGIALFISAWGVFWIGGLVATLRVLDLIPTNGVTSYALQISSAIEMTLFAFALAEMIKIEKRERLSAQNALLEAKQALLDTLISQEAQLEKTIEERTSELNSALRKEKALLSQFVRFGSLISHEFRNPLGVINSQATLLKKEQSLNPAGENRITAIKMAVRRLVSLFDKWLEGDRLESMLHQKLLTQTMPAERWLKTLLKQNANLFEHHRIITAPDPTATNLHADPDLLEIAMLNLLENACKYSAPQSRIMVQIVNETAGTGFAVTDEGIGISQSQQEEIFNDYVRLDHPSHPGQPGLGLGLAFVKRIMLAHGGDVRLESTPGTGSTFTLLFPSPSTQLHG
jgi:signal transduction histidine kinase